MPHVKTNTPSLSAAIEAFEANLPGWWFSVATCQVSRDASCGPTTAGRDAHLLSCRAFDGGFHADLRDADSQMADALGHVMSEAIEARKIAEEHGLPKTCSVAPCSGCPVSAYMEG